MLRVVCLCVLATLMAGVAHAQNKLIKDGLVWSLVSVTADLANGSKSEPSAPTRRESSYLLRTDILHCSSHAPNFPRLPPTIAPRRPPRRQQRSLPDRLLISGRIRSMKAERSLSVTLDGSTFPNLLAGPVQKRLITSLDTHRIEVCQSANTLRNDVADSVETCGGALKV